MKLKTNDIKPNPFRDMDIDPINDRAVESLKRSINDHDFWNGLLVRKVGGFYQLVFGHNRLEAAIRAGIKEIEVPIVRWDDDHMVRAMAAENSTQREANFSACANDVAAAMRVLGYQMLTNDECPELFSTIVENNMSWGKAKGLFLDGNGLGEGLLFKYFDGRLTKRILREAIAQMKASGKMVEITDEVIDKAIAAGHEIDAPNLEPTEKTFDMAVGQIITNPSQLAAFRKSVTTRSGQEAIPVDNQVNFAKALVSDVAEMTRKTGRKQPLTAEVVRKQVAEGIDQLVPTNVVKDKISGAIRAHGTLQKKVVKTERDSSEPLTAKHDWSYARNKLSHAHGHMGDLKATLEKGIRPAGFDALEAEAWFNNQFDQFVTLAEDVKKLMSIYFIEEQK